MKRPIVIVAIGYIIGIVWGLYCNCSIALLYTIIIPISFLFKKNYKSKRKLKIFSIKRYLRYIKIFLNQNVILAIIISSIISNTITINQNRRYNTLYTNIRNTTIRGIVVSNLHSTEYSNVYKIKVEKVNDNIKYKNTYLFMYISKDYNIEINFGDEIELKGEYLEPAIDRNYKGFNYKEYLKTQKVYGMVKVDNVKKITKQKINPIFILSNNIFIKIKRNMENNLPNDIANLTLGIILGYTDNLNDEIQQNFIDSNMAYILAVSGMHISYVISGLMLIFRIIGIGKKRAKIIIIVVLAIYMLITGFTPSVVRATIMGILYLGSSIFYRKNDVWTSIAISLLCILVYNPFLLKDISVELSYIGTVGIIIFNKTITKLLEKIKTKDKKYKYKKFENISKFIISSIAISLSVHISIIPIYINSFNKISLGFLITNFVVSLLIGPIIIIGFFIIVSSLISIQLLKVISIIITPVLKILVLVSKLSKEMPFSKVYIRTLFIPEIVIYYCFITVVNFIFKVYNTKVSNAFEYRIKNMISLIKYKCRLYNKMIISYILIICILFSVIVMLPKDLRIYFIDVGEGDSTLIITPTNKSILIDGGGSLDKSYEVGKSVLLPYLFDRGVTKLDYIFVSHFDQDHVRWVTLRA